MIIIGFAYDLITEFFTSRAGEGVGAGERAGECAGEYAGNIWGMWMARGMLGIRDLLCTGQVNHSGGSLDYRGGTSPIPVMRTNATPWCIISKPARTFPGFW